MFMIRPDSNCTFFFLVPLRSYVKNVFDIFPYPGTKLPFRLVGSRALFDFVVFDIPGELTVGRLAECRTLVDFVVFDIPGELTVGRLAKCRTLVDPLLRLIALNLLLNASTFIRGETPMFFAFVRFDPADGLPITAFMI